MTDPQRTKISGSNIFRVIACPASANIGNKNKELAFHGNQFSRRGTELHKAAESAIIARLNHLPSPAIPEEVLNYVDYVTSFAQEGHKILPEARLELSLSGFKARGTADAIMLKDDEADVVDLKTGHEPVSPVDNSQLLFYAASVAKDNPGVKTFRLTIHQNGEADSVIATRDDIHVFVEKAVLAVALALSEDPPRKTGDHCRGCSQAASCPAALALMHKIQETNLKNLPSVTSELLFEAEIAQYVIDAIKETARLRARAGQPFPGYQLVQPYGRRTWKEETKETLSALEEVGVDEDIVLGGRAFVSVAEAKKRLKEKGLPLNLIDKFITVSKPEVRLEKIKAKPSGTVVSSLAFDDGVDPHVKIV